MGNIQLDKNYNIKEENKKETYENSFGNIVALILDARDRKIISEVQASFLLNVALSKELKEEVKSVFPFTNKKLESEIHTLFMNLKTKQLKHA